MFITEFNPLLLWYRQYYEDLLYWLHRIQNSEHADALIDKSNEAYRSKRDTVVNFVNTVSLWYQDVQRDILYSMIRNMSKENRHDLKVYIGKFD